MTIFIYILETSQFSQIGLRYNIQKPHETDSKMLLLEFNVVFWAKLRIAEPWVRVRRSVSISICATKTVNQTSTSYGAEAKSSIISIPLDRRNLVATEIRKCQRGNWDQKAKKQNFGLRQILRELKFAKMPFILLFTKLFWLTSEKGLVKLE